MLSNCSRSVPRRRRQLPLIPSSATTPLLGANPSLSLLLQFHHRPHKSHNNSNSSTRLASSLASYPSTHPNPYHSDIQTTKVTTRRRNMSFHFGSSEYAATFVDLPLPDTKALRNSALDYLKEFNPQSWYDDPVREKHFCLLSWTTTLLPRRCLCLLLLLFWFIPNGQTICPWKKRKKPISHIDFVCFCWASPTPRLRSHFQLKTFQMDEKIAAHHFNCFGLESSICSCVCLFLFCFII